MRRSLDIFTVATVVFTMSGIVHAQAPVVDSRQLEARIARLEQALSGGGAASGGSRQLHDTLQGLSREVRELRGDIELQRHALEQLKQRQRELYLDLDRRMQALEAGGSAVGGVAPSAGETTPETTPKPAPSSAAAAAPTRPGAGVSTPQPAPPVQSVDLAAEQQAYQDAFELLKGGQFTQASAALTKFLSDYPSGRFSDNAWYWLGESYYVNREFGPALKAFEQLLVDFPDSAKRSHAMLKVGFIHDEEGRREQAKQVLTDLVKTFPQSTAASLASKRLQRLQ